jgi:serine/threonine-protein kinase SRPK3
MPSLPKAFESQVQIEEVQEGVEDGENYKMGGHHPIHLGDRLHNDSYEIIHRLGHGSHSIVWLAKDHRCPNGHNVAIKIVAARRTDVEQEIECLRHLQNGPADHPGKRYILCLHDDFSLDGPNGIHRCIVLRPAGCDLRACKSPGKKGFTAECARAIAARTLLGLAYMHSRGVIHGGKLATTDPLSSSFLTLCYADLTMNNIVLQSPDILKLSPGQLYWKYGDPKRIPVANQNGKGCRKEVPAYSVVKLANTIPASEVVGSDIVISDFGEAHILPSKPTGSNTYAALRPPEYLLGLSDVYGMAGDIWSAACVLYNVLAIYPLFDLPTSCLKDEEADNVLKQILHLLGPPPADMLAAWDHGEKYCARDQQKKEKKGTARADPMIEKINCMKNCRGHPQHDFSNEEMISFCHLLESMLTWCPSNRISADEACKSEWMQKWGLPAIKQTGG